MAEIEQDKQEEIVPRLEIDGDGSSADLDEDLRAIAQRVSLYDGSLSMLPGGGGFSVHARLPLGAAVPA